MDWKAGLATSSPLVAHFGEVGARLTVVILYDDAGRLAPVGMADRDAACEWAAFLVGPYRVDLPPGLTVFATAELGVSTIGELHERGHTAARA